jgi:hypothetical protein
MPKNDPSRTYIGVLLLEDGDGELYKAVRI